MKKAKPYLLPYLAQCPAYEPSGEDRGGAMRAGASRHEALEAALKGDTAPLGALDEETREGVQWAVEYINVKAPAADWPLMVEYEAMPVDAEFGPMFNNPGRIDVVCGPVFFDLKWQPKDYWAQMAAYALAVIQEQGFPEVTGHVLFGATKSATTWKFREGPALKRVSQIIKDANQPDPPATPNDNCGWCAKLFSCPAVAGLVNQIIENRPDFQLEQYHTSQLKTPKELGAALRIARVVGKWCDGVSYRTAQAYKKEGITPEGFKASMSAGKKSVGDVQAAFESVGLPQEAFLKACDVNLARLIDQFADLNDMKKAPAKREVERRLGPVIKTGDPFPIFRKDKTQTKN